MLQIIFNTVHVGSESSTLCPINAFFLSVVDERRRSQGNSFGDSNQLFLGNLPHIATEDDLRDIFLEFGQIIELRIHSKPQGGYKGQTGARNPPNYGFITYENQQAVQNCLQAKVSRILFL